MRKSKNNSISEGELFARLSRRSNSLPESTVREVYYGLIKLIVDQFKDGRDIILPGFGKVYVVTLPKHRRHNIATGAFEEKNTRRITFTACVELRKYVNVMTIKD